MAIEVETHAKCKTCGGGLIFRDTYKDEGGEWAAWGHVAPLSETAGHKADPDPATTVTVER